MSDTFPKRVRIGKAPPKEAVDLLLHWGSIGERSRRILFARIEHVNRFLSATVALSPTERFEEREARLRLLSESLSEAVAAGFTKVDWPAPGCFKFED